MRVILQRVSSARVEVEEDCIASIGSGFLLLLGISREDTEEEGRLMAAKVAGLRVFTDEADKMNLSLLDCGGSVLVVPNFTLYANCRHGRRPEFLSAARPETANPLFKKFLLQLKAAGVRDVQQGRFGADMKVGLVNDGPVTIVLDTDDWKPEKSKRGT